MAVDLVYRCSPLASWLSVRQCRLNAQRGRRARRAQPGTPEYSEAIAEREACKGCPGVVHRSEAEGIAPKSAADLLAGRQPAEAPPRRSRRRRYKQPSRITPDESQRRRAQERRAARKRAPIRARMREEEAVTRRMQPPCPPDQIELDEIVDRLGFKPTSRSRARKLVEEVVEPVAPPKRGTRTRYPRQPVEQWIAARHQAERALEGEEAPPPAPAEPLPPGQVVAWNPGAIEVAMAILRAEIAEIDRDLRGVADRLAQLLKLLRGEEASSRGEGT